MATDEVGIYNMALSSIGTRSSVSSLTENSREREVCSIWYETVRDLVLSAAFWPSVRKWTRLAQIATRADFNTDWTKDDPSPQWTYVYATPTDLLTPRFLSTYGRFTMELYTPTDGSETLAIMTDEAAPILCYSKRDNNVSRWHASLQMAVAYALGAYICQPLTGKLTTSLQMERKANDLIAEARAATANEQEERYESIPDWIAARGTALANPRTKFLFPYGPMLSISGEAGAIRVADVS